MAIYIDADALIKTIFPCDVVDPKCYSINAKTIYEAIKKAPTADVVPKSEVAILSARYAGLAIAKNELQFEFDTYKGANKILVDNMAELIKGAIDQAKQEVAREIFEEIDTLFERFYNDAFYSSGDLGYDIAELKKKYTE